MRDVALVLGPLIPGLRRFARALEDDTSAADDLVQDCLERAVERWHQRRPDGSAKAWVFTILHNLVRDRLRRRRRRGIEVDLAELPDDALVEQPRQEQGLATTEVMRAIRMLPEEQQSVLLLVSVEDFSYAEAAQALGVPVGTVMSRLSRSRERLRRILEGEVIGMPQLRRIK